MTLLSAGQHDTFAAAAALFDTPVQDVSIPYGDTTLPAYLFLLDDSGAARDTRHLDRSYQKRMIAYLVRRDRYALWERRQLLVCVPPAGPAGLPPPWKAFSGALWLRSLPSFPTAGAQPSFSACVRFSSSLSASLLNGPAYPMTDLFSCLLPS